MLKAHVVCTGKGLKSNLEHPKASDAVVGPETAADVVSFYLHRCSF